jgi:hypothetical protein
VNERKLEKGTSCKARSLLLLLCAHVEYYFFYGVSSSPGL